MNLTLIAYKRNSENVCRGCEMDRYQSDFQWLCGRQQEIIHKWANLLFDNSQMERGESEYEITLLVDGSDFSDDNTYSETEAELRYLAVEMFKTLEVAEVERKKRVVAHEKAEATKRERKEKLKQYIKLKAEFEPEGELP